MVLCYNFSFFFRALFGAASWQMLVFVVLASSSIFPNGFQVEVPSLLGTAHTPALALVAAVHAETHRPGTRNVEAAPSHPITAALGSLGRRLHLRDLVSFNGRLLGVGRVLNRLQAGDAGAAGARRRRRRRHGRGRVGARVSRGKRLVELGGGEGWRGLRGRRWRATAEEWRHGPAALTAKVVTGVHVQGRRAVQSPARGDAELLLL